MVADHLSRLVHTDEDDYKHQRIDDVFPKDHLYWVQKKPTQDDDYLWFVDFKNYLIG